MEEIVNTTENAAKTVLSVAKAHPFDGAPVIHLPSLYGIPSGKGFIQRIPVTGKRPVRISVDGLVDGMTFADGILSGTVSGEKTFRLTVTAENECGRAEKQIEVRCAPECQLLTPLLGFTSWSAYGSAVSQEIIETVAEQLVDAGIADYGYQYINIDSGWQKEYGGIYDAVMPNAKFPDMRAMCKKLHGLGFRCGIYSTPMLTAWGCPSELPSIPGCTVGEPDDLFPNTNGGIGKDHREQNNVRQWEDWGFDYLKYDWDHNEPIIADRMRRELVASDRAFAFCVTVCADRGYVNYWKKYCNAWRDNNDSNDQWERVLSRYNTVERWTGAVSNGHFYDLDMLEIGAMYWNGGGTCRLTEDEELFAFTMRAFFLSPIQLSCRIEKLTPFERDLVCNDEILRLHQDARADYPHRIYSYEDRGGKIRIYERALENGDRAVAIFNADETALDEKLTVTADAETAEKISGLAGAVVRDVWANEDVYCGKGDFAFSVPAHSARVFRIRK